MSQLEYDNYIKHMAEIQGFDRCIDMVIENASELINSLLKLRRITEDIAQKKSLNTDSIVESCHDDMAALYNYLKALECFFLKDEIEVRKRAKMVRFENCVANKLITPIDEIERRNQRILLSKLLHNLE